MKLVKIESLAQAEEEMKAVKSEGIDKMASKAVFKIVKIEGLDQNQAHVIKEEMISAGSDAAISVSAWNKEDTKTDVLIFGTLKQYESFLEGIERRELFSLSKQIKNLILY